MILLTFNSGRHNKSDLIVELNVHIFQFLLFGEFSCLFLIIIEPGGIRLVVKALNITTDKQIHTKLHRPCCE